MEAARPAVLDDLPRIVELAEGAKAELAPLRGGSVWSRLEGRAAPVQTSLAAALADPEQLCLVGCIDDYIVGYSVSRRVTLHDGATLAMVEDLYVEHPFRAVGVGEALMETILEWAAARGCEGVESLALPGDRDTKNFFETFGLVARMIRVFRPLPTT